MLSSCQQIDELQILNGEIIRSLAISAISMPLYGNITTLVLVILVNENPTTLKELLVKFPNVNKLQMTQNKGSSSGSEKAMNIFLCEYIKANNGTLKVSLIYLIF